MTIENRPLFITDVDDNTGKNPQRGYFAVIKAVGPFLSEQSAQEYLDKEPVD